jgi:hypothetical protein
MRCNNQFDFGEIWQQEKMIRSWRDCNFIKWLELAQALLPILPRSLAHP